jgi:hypothetical protein
MCLQGLRYLAYPIRLFFVTKEASRSLVVHADLCRAPRGLILWAGPPLGARPMYNHVGIRGYTPTVIVQLLDPKCAVHESLAV